MNALTNEENTLFELNQKLNNAKALEVQAKEILKGATTIKAEVQNELSLMMGQQLTDVYNSKDEPFGTARIKFPNLALDVVADTPKKVEWDQDKLNDFVISTIMQNQEETYVTRDGLIEALANIRQYVKLELSVSETSYKAWPNNIKEYFEPARTVKTGKTTITIEDKA